jgi:RNA polymerase sigma factor (sigma-70 family)
LKNGYNKHILEHLYTGVFPKVKAYILSNSGNKDDAIDIFQDAIVILCKQVQLGRYNSNYEVAAFLYSVSKNLWINKVKKDKRQIEFSENFEEDRQYDFTEDIITDQKADILQKAIRELGKKCFELLQYAFYQKLSGEEICEKMGFATVNSVKTQKYKCKQKLIKMIEMNPLYREVLD